MNLFAKEEKLEKELSEVRLAIQEQVRTAGELLLDEVKEEINSLKNASFYNQEETIEVNVTYTIKNFKILYRDLFDSDISSVGQCKVEIKQKLGLGLGIQEEVKNTIENNFDDHRVFEWIGINSKEQIGCISSNTKKFIEMHENCRQDLIKKASSIGKKLGLTTDVVNRLLKSYLGSG